MERSVGRRKRDTPGRAVLCAHGECTEACFRLCAMSVTPVNNLQPVGVVRCVGLRFLPYSTHFVVHPVMRCAREAAEPRRVSCCISRGWRERYLRWSIPPICFHVPRFHGGMGCTTSCETYTSTFPRRWGRQSSLLEVARGRFVRDTERHLA